MPILQSDECVNDDSSEDSAGDTCTDWYDAHPEDCRGQYDDEDFSATNQCCASSPPPPSAPCFFVEL